VKKFRTSFVVIAVSAVSAIAMSALASGDLVMFPNYFESGVRYATVERGNIKEDIFSSREAVEAVKRGDPLPSGTVITLVDYRDGRLFRYVVMEKRSGWGAQYSESKRNGEWEYQAFKADKSVNHGENLDRCCSCTSPRRLRTLCFRLAK
jgi:hypothetical protein